MRCGLVFSGLMIVALCLCAAQTANATVLAYEGFNYTTEQNIGGLNGGSGWGAAWTAIFGNGWLPAPGGSLIGPNATGNAASTGNALREGFTRDGRFLDTSSAGAFAGYLDANGNIGKDGTTLYLSFLQQVTTETPFYAFEFHKDDLGDAGRVGYIGADGNDNDCVSLHVPNGTNLMDTQDTNAHLYVVRFDFLAGDDTVTVYRDPTDAIEPSSATLVIAGAGDMSFDGISTADFKSSGNTWTDEIRLATTFADAIGTPVPEPSTIVLMVTAAFGLVAYAWRKRR